MEPLVDRKWPNICSDCRKNAIKELTKYGMSCFCCIACDKCILLMENGK